MYGLVLKTWTNGEPGVVHDPVWYGSMVELETDLRAILQAAKLDGMRRVSFDIALPIDKSAAKLEYIQG